MFSLTSCDRYYLCTSGVDLRKGFNSLCGVVRSVMGHDPLSGDVYIFINSTRTTIKLLHWERGGLVIYHKRLEQGRFTLPKFDEQTQSYTLAYHQLVMMVEGVSALQIKHKKRYEKVIKKVG